MFTLRCEKKYFSDALMQANCGKTAISYLSTNCPCGRFTHIQPQQVFCSRRGGNISQTTDSFFDKNMFSSRAAIGQLVQSYTFYIREENDFVCRFPSDILKYFSNQVKIKF